MFLNLGPNHPSAHGAFRIILQLDGEEVKDCVPDIVITTVVWKKWLNVKPGTFIPFYQLLYAGGLAAQNMPLCVGVRNKWPGITGS